MEEDKSLVELNKERMNLLLRMGEEAHRLVRKEESILSERMRELSEAMKQVDIQVAKLKCGRYVRAEAREERAKVFRENQCKACGTRIRRQYCPECGSSAIHWEIEYEQNESVQKKQIALQKPKHSWRSFIGSSVLFSVLLNGMMYLIAVMLEVIVRSGIKPQYSSIPDIEEAMRLMNLKGNIMALMYGLDITWKIEARAYEQVVKFGVRAAIPFLFLFVTIFLVFVAEWLRRKITKQNLTLGIIILNALVNGVVVTGLLTMMLGEWHVLSPWIASTVLTRIHSARYMIRHKGFGMESILYITLITFVIQFMIVRKGWMDEKVQRLVHTIRSMFAVLLMISLLGGAIVGFATASVMTKNAGETGWFVYFILGLQLGTGIFINILSRGRIAMCSLMSGFDRYDFNLGLFQCTLSGKQQLSVWHPFGGMLTTLFLVMLAILFYSACRYYCGSRKNLRKAAGEAFVIAGGLSLLVVLVQKVCSSSTQIRRTYGNGDETCEWYRIARGSLLNAWFLQLLYFFLIFLAAYLVTVYAPKIPKKLAECKPLLVKVGVLLASIAVIVIGSVTVTPERMSQFNQDMDQEEMKQFVQELQVTSKKMQRNLRCLK